MTTLIANAHIPDGDGFRRASLLIRDGLIAGIETDPEEFAHLAAERVDASKHWVLPGLIDSHAHGYATILRGTENSLPLEMWALYTVAYGKALDARAMHASIMLGAAERLRAGIIGTVDHSPQHHLAESALDAHARSGLRVAFAPFLHDISDYDLMALDLPPEVRALAGSLPKLDEAAYEARFAEIVSAATGKVTVQLGPNAPQRCSPEAMALWRRLRDRHGLRVHTHLLETHAQMKVGQQHFPGGIVAEMARQDLLNPGLSVAHGVWTDDADRALLAEHGVTVAHNPASNMMLGSGRLSFAGYQRQGIPLGLGSDSANTGGRHDLFELMRLAMMWHRKPGTDPATWPDGPTVLRMGSANGATVIGQGSGVIEAGAPADFVMLRRNTIPGLLLRDSLEGMLLHASPDMVDAVVIDGSWAMRGGDIVAFDETAVLAEAGAAQAEIRARLGDAPDLIKAALPALAQALKPWQAPGG